MKMNYYALFLNGESYIEKCIILIKYISNPGSKSLPHVTLRIVKGQDDRLSYFDSKRFSYLNIIEPGSFNMEQTNKSPVVFLKCESEELEEIDYRPDYPFSRLHITLYEGSDFKYAKSLLSLLEKMSWHFRLTFDFPKHLSEQAMGSLKNTTLNYASIYKDILGENYLDISTATASNEKKLEVVQAILENLKDYLGKQEADSKNIESLYKSRVRPNSSNFIDGSESGTLLAEEQLAIKGFPNELVEKPVQDAIYVTPPEYARDMAQCAIEAFGADSREILFGDSAIGTGALFIAVKRLVDAINAEEGHCYVFKSAIGVDIDYNMAAESYLRCSKRNLKVIYGDAISPNIDLGEKRNMMIVNPPYNRHEDIPLEYRSQAKQLAMNQTGITISADAGLYVYHLLIMDKWLEDDGVGVWLIPSIFLQARYGMAIRKYLTENVQLIQLHVYNEEKLQFDDTLISTTIIVFRKAIPSNSQMVKVSFGDSVSNPLFSKEILLDDLKKELKNWRSMIVNTQINAGQEKFGSVLTFSDLFEVKRGLATGANSFFVMDRDKAKKKGIPEEALKPLLPKARYLQSQIVNAKEDGYPDIEKQLVLIDTDLEENTIKTTYPDFYKYLQKAYEKDDDGKAIIDRFLVKKRTPWYKQERRDPPLFVLTYMGRRKSDLPSLYFILNQSKAVALNTYLLLYPKEWLMNLLKIDDSLSVQLLASLNLSSKKVIELQTRIYSGGLQKLEPNELKELPIVNLPKGVIEAFRSNDHS